MLDLQEEMDIICKDIFDIELGSRNSFEFFIERDLTRKDLQTLEPCMDIFIKWRSKVAWSNDFASIERKFFRRLKKKKLLNEIVPIKDYSNTDILKQKDNYKVAE